MLVFLFPVLIFGQSTVEKADELFQQKRFMEAEKLLSTHIAKHPNDLKAIEQLGDAFGHQRKWNAAIKQYHSLTKRVTNNANYHFKYGGALGMKALSISKIRAVGLVGDIKRAFLRAAELDRKHIDTRWALVELYIQLPGIIGGSIKKSLQYAQELEDLSKVDGYLAKGYVYEYDNKPVLAEKYYKLAIVEGGSITCFDKLTAFYQNHHQPENAVANLEEAYERHNLNALHYQIGKVCADYNIQLEKGERCLKVYIENHTARDGISIEWAYLRLAQIFRNKKDKNEALKWIDKALEVKANFKQAKKERQYILAI